MGAIRPRGPSPPHRPASFTAAPCRGGEATGGTTLPGCGDWGELCTAEAALEAEIRRVNEVNEQRAKESSSSADVRADVDADDALVTWFADVSRGGSGSVSGSAPDPAPPSTSPSRASPSTTTPRRRAGRLRLSTSPPHSPAGRGSRHPHGWRHGFYEAYTERFIRREGGARTPRGGGQGGAERRADDDDQPFQFEEDKGTGTGRGTSDGPGPGPGPGPGQETSPGAHGYSPPMPSWIVRELSASPDDRSPSQSPAYSHSPAGDSPHSPAGDSPHLPAGDSPHSPAGDSPHSHALSRKGAAGADDDSLHLSALTSLSSPAVGDVRSIEDAVEAAVREMLDDRWHELEERLLRSVAARGFRPSPNLPVQWAQGVDAVADLPIAVVAEDVLRAVARGEEERKEWKQKEEEAAASLHWGGGDGGSTVPSSHHAAVLVDWETGHVRSGDRCHHLGDQRSHQGRGHRGDHRQRLLHDHESLSDELGHEERVDQPTSRRRRSPGLNLEASARQKPAWESSLRVTALDDKTPLLLVKKSIDKYLERRRQRSLSSASSHATTRRGREGAMTSALERSLGAVAAAVSSRSRRWLYNVDDDEDDEDEDDDVDQSDSCSLEPFMSGDVLDSKGDWGSPSWPEAPSADVLAFARRRRRRVLVHALDEWSWYVRWGNASADAHWRQRRLAWGVKALRAQKTAAAVTARLAEALAKRVRWRLACATLRGWMRAAKLSKSESTRAKNQLWPAARPLRSTQRSVETMTDPPEVAEVVKVAEVAGDGTATGARESAAVVGATPADATTSEPSKAIAALTTESVIEMVSTGTGGGEKMGGAQQSPAAAMLRPRPTPLELLATETSVTTSVASDVTSDVATSAPVDPSPGSLRQKHSSQRRHDGHQIHIHIHQQRERRVAGAARDEEMEKTTANIETTGRTEDNGADDNLAGESGDGGACCGASSGGGFSPEHSSRVAQVTEEAAQAVGVAVRGLLSLWEDSPSVHVEGEDEEESKDGEVEGHRPPPAAASSRSSPLQGSERSDGGRQRQPVPQDVRGWDDVRGEEERNASAETAPPPSPAPSVRTPSPRAARTGVPTQTATSPSSRAGWTSPSSWTPVQTSQTPTVTLARRMCRVIYTERGGAFILTPPSSSPGRGDGNGGGVDGGAARPARKSRSPLPTYISVAEYLDGVNKATLTP